MTQPAHALSWNIPGTEAPLYAPRIEDLGQSDFVKVDCAACHHVALLTPEFLLWLGLSSQAKVLDLKERVRCRGCGVSGRAVVSLRRRIFGAVLRPRGDSPPPRGEPR